MRLFMASFFLFFSSLCCAEVEVTHADLSYQNHCLVSQYAFRLVLPEDLKNLIQLGISVYVGSEFRVLQKRFLWFDTLITDTHQEWRISYHAITGKYYLTKRGGYLFFDDLETLLAHFNKEDTWVAFCSADFLNDVSYEAMIHFFIMTERLPPVFQIGSGGYIRWQSDSGWLRWNLTFRNGQYWGATRV